MTYEELQDAIDNLEEVFATLLRTAVVTTDGSLVSVAEGGHPDDRLPGKFYGPQTQMVIDAATRYALQIADEEAGRPEPVGWRVKATWAPGCDNAGQDCNYVTYSKRAGAQELLDWLIDGDFVGNTVVDPVIEEVYE